MNYLITVLIPTFNDLKGFQRIVEAYSKDERVKIIVSDDSDDKYISNSIKNKCLEQGIVYFDGTKSSPVKNWNKLMKKIDTPFFVLNHHDEYPNNLKFLDLLESCQIGLIVLPCSSISNNKKVNKIYSWQQKIFSKICLFSPNASFNILLSPTASLIVNSKIKNIIFDENLQWFVDCDWYCRIINKIKRNNLKIRYFYKSRIISIQYKRSITSKLRNKLTKIINQEKFYLKQKGLMPNYLISFFQLICLALILLPTKFKKILFRL